MKKRTILFNAISIPVVLISLIIVIFLPETTNTKKFTTVWTGIKSLKESIQTKSSLNKDFTNIKKGTKFFKKSYKVILAGGASLAFAANAIVSFKRKKDD